VNFEKRRSFRIVIPILDFDFSQNPFFNVGLIVDCGRLSNSRDGKKLFYFLIVNSIKVKNKFVSLIKMHQ